jgi:hypothetical protein
MTNTARFLGGSFALILCTYATASSLAVSPCTSPVLWSDRSPTVSQGSNKDREAFGQGSEDHEPEVTLSELDTLCPTWSDCDVMMLTSADEVVMRRCR